MKKHTLSVAILFGLTPCYIQPVGKVSELCKKMITLVKGNFTTYKKSWIGVMTATGFGVGCYKLYPIHLEKRIKHMIDRCIMLEQPCNMTEEEKIKAENVWDLTTIFISKNPEYATRYTLENFEKIVQSGSGYSLVWRVLDLNPSAIDLYITEALKFKDQLIESQHGIAVLVELIDAQTYHQKKINVELNKLAINQFSQLAATGWGINCLTNISKVNKENDQVLVEATKKNIEAILKEPCFNKGGSLVLSVLKKNPDFADWCSNYAINNFEKFYGNFCAEYKLFAEIISLSKDDDALKFKELITAHTLEKGESHIPEYVTQALHDRMKKFDNNQINKQSSCLLETLLKQ